MTESVPVQSGTIVKGVGGSYEIHLSGEAVVLAKPRGIFRKDKITPTIGDHVEVEPSGDPDTPYMICRILPRKNLLIRPSVANVDILILTFSPIEPQPDFRLLDKLLILCEKQEIKPVIWLTKTDLDANEVDRIRTIYQGAGFEVFTSALDQPLDYAFIRPLFHGNTVGFAGQSGVGKSTICNILTGNTSMKVGAVSERLHRGKHTTRHVELFPVEDGYLMDTPGFSTLELTEIGLEADDVQYGYPELKKIAGKCKFQDCRHIGELGCAIDEAQMDPDRLLRYREFVSILIKNKIYATKR
ncbi:MAG: ribosome small subunit-dependent GTPase A [Eubacteriales bacterium]